MLEPSQSQHHALMVWPDLTDSRWSSNAEAHFYLNSEMAKQAQAQISREEGANER